MSILDNKLILSDEQAITETADTTNTLDIGGARDLGANYHGSGYVNIRCLEDVAGTSLTFQLKDSADGTTFANLGDSVDIGAMNAGDVKVIKLSETKRFLKGAFTASAITAGKFSVYVGQPED